MVKPGVSWRKGAPPCREARTSKPKPGNQLVRVCSSAQSMKPAQLRRTDTPPAHLLTGAFTRGKQAFLHCTVQL